MQVEVLEALVTRAGNQTTRDPDFVRDMLQALGSAANGEAVDAEVLCSLESAVALVDRILPAWRIGLERSGGWRCTLREGSARDDDELIGIASGPTPAQALLAALLAVVARRARGYR